MGEIVKEGTLYIIYLKKDIIASTADELKTELHSLIAESPEKLVIDLAGVKMVDSIGIGVIIATYNSLNKIKSKLELANVTENIYNVLTTMRLNHYFTINRIE